MNPKSVPTGSFTLPSAGSTFGQDGGGIAVGEGGGEGGGEALTQELLLTLKVPLTHRITLNLSAHTAVSETIRAVDKRGKLDGNMIRAH